MDVTGVSTQPIVNQTTATDGVSTAVLKKALDIQEQSAAQLIEAIPELPDNLGQNVNVKV